jgi:hypothetical protein
MTEHSSRHIHLRSPLGAKSARLAVKAHYRHLIAESERDPKRDEDRHKMLLTLLAEEITKGKKLAADQSAFASQAHHGPWRTSSSAVPGPD